MKVVRIEAIPFAIPYVKPLRFASGEVHTAEHVLVRLHTDDGVVGVAEAPPRPFTYGETQTGIVAVIEQIFAPQIVGLTLLEREVAGARLARTSAIPPPNPHSTWRCGMRWAARWNCPVSAMLGGFTDRMRVSHMLGFEEPAAMVAEADRMRRQLRDPHLQGEGGSSPGRHWTPPWCGPCGSTSVTRSNCTSTATAAGRRRSRCGP